jgi:hypothetical protein
VVLPRDELLVPELDMADVKEGVDVIGVIAAFCVAAKFGKSVMSVVIVVTGMVLLSTVATTVSVTGISVTEQ